MKTYVSERRIPRNGVLGGGEWVLSGLKGLTVLFGKNGSGKSLLLRSWRDSDKAGTHYIVPERTGEFGYNANYLQPQLGAETRSNQSTRNFITEYRTQTLARIQAYYLERGAGRSGGLSEPTPDELEFFLALLLPDFEFTLRNGVPPFKIVRVADHVEISNADQLSSGEAQLLSLAIDVLTIAAIWHLQEAASRVLLIDEPDAHIHPDLQVRFADFLVQVSDRFRLQVVVATHSTTLLAAIGQFGKEDTAHVYIDRTNNTLVARPFTDVLKELASILGGHALMGPLFGVPLLLVEGDDDYRIWSQVPRHHVVAFAVVPCGGDKIREYQGSLERVFQSLREPGAGSSGYALLDGDKPEPEAGRPSQTHVRFVRLACREAENLYLTNEVLAQLGTTWNEAAVTIGSRAGDFGNKSAELLRAADWDRKTEDLKGVINEVSKILDTKGVHWTQRVGVAIGTQRPTGELGEWLGPSVVESLWGPEIRNGAL
jgi:predicted ATPase